MVRDMEQFVSIIKDYTEFNSKTSSSDMVLFGEWLKKKYSKDTSVKTEISNQQEVNLQILNSLIEISEIINRLVKSSIQVANIQSSLDTRILLFVFNQNGKSLKKDIVEIIFAERTTILESIKRLCKRGFLKEKTYSKRIENKLLLTKTGKELAIKIASNTDKIANLISSKLSLTQKQTLIPLLVEICSLNETLSRSKTNDLHTLLD